MEAPPAVVKTRRERMDTRRLRVALYCLGAAVTSFLLGIVVGLTITVLALTAFLLIGFEISRPVAKRRWLDSAWATVIFGLAFLPPLGLLALMVQSQVPYSGPLPRGVHSGEDLAILVGAWGAGICCTLASVHIVRRRGPSEVRRVFRHVWILAGVTLLAFFSSSSLFEVVLLLWMFLILIVGIAAVVFVILPVRRIQSPPADPEPLDAAPTFQSYRGT